MPTLSLCSFLLTMTAVICWSMKMRMVPSRAGTTAAKGIHGGIRFIGLTTQPRPSRVVVRFCGTLSFGVSTPTPKSNRVMPTMAMMTAKSEMKLRTLAGKKEAALKPLRCHEMRKVPRKRRTLMKKALGTKSQAWPSTTAASPSTSVVNWHGKWEECFPAPPPAPAPAPWCPSPSSNTLSYSSEAVTFQASAQDLLLGTQKQSSGMMGRSSLMWTSFSMAFLMKMKAMRVAKFSSVKRVM